MSNLTKAKYLNELKYFEKSLNRPLSLIYEILPLTYNEMSLLKLFKKLYPYEWQTICKRYTHYQEKDNFLVQNGKKRRYKHLSPYNYFFSLKKVKHILCSSQKIKHMKNYDEEIVSAKFKQLKAKRDVSIQKRQLKIQEYKNLLQKVEPLFIDIFIGAYHLKNSTLEEKLEVVNELQKYDSKKIIRFFSKLNDSERNTQIRIKVFKHLQNMGEYVKLRKNFKGKKKSYMLNRVYFNMSPKDLIERIEKNDIQNKKVYDVFISHSSLDVEEVQKVKNILNNYNKLVYVDWISDIDFLKRSYISVYTELALKKRVEQSKSIIFIKTNNSVDKNNNIQSYWINLELEHAKKLDKKIIYIDFNILQDNEIEKELSLIGKFL
ncbi:MAG: toll/interleukin-1 receptor domain-containing protein [Candidatus Gracilibacteria bacterium]